MSGEQDRQTLFHRILPAATRRLTSTTAVDWSLKFKDKKCDVGQIKNYYITVSTQKISSIHKLIPQILRSHELTDQAYQKNFWSTFNLHEFVSTCNKSDYFTDLF